MPGDFINALCGAYIDLAKAFDSVPRWAIVESLRSWHTPESTIAQILSIIEGHTVILRSATPSQPIPVNIGVLQGDTLSPFLFIIVVDAVLRLLYSFDGVSDVTKHHTNVRFLVYADDMLIVSNDPADVQGMFLEFEKAVTELGMKINYGKGKTEAFEVCMPDEPHLQLKNSQGAVIPLVPFYKYLGAHVLEHCQRKSMGCVAQICLHLESATPSRVKAQPLSEPGGTYPVISNVLLHSKRVNEGHH